MTVVGAQIHTHKKQARAKWTVLVSHPVTCLGDRQQHQRQAGADKRGAFHGSKRICCAPFHTRVPSKVHAAAQACPGAPEAMAAGASSGVPQKLHQHLPESSHSSLHMFNFMMVFQQGGTAPAQGWRARRTVVSN